jgi:hypothetical protein
MVKYMVRLNTEEREQLLTLVTTGRAAAAKLLHARILLTADVAAGLTRTLLRPWTPALPPSIGCARPGSKRAWRRHDPANAQQAGSIANWTGSRRRR